MTPTMPDSTLEDFVTINIPFVLNLLFDVKGPEKCQRCAHQLRRLGILLYAFSRDLIHPLQDVVCLPIDSGRQASMSNWSTWAVVDEVIWESADAKGIVRLSISSPFNGQIFAILTKHCPPRFE